MHRGQFTKSHRLHIETYLKAFTALLDTGASTRKQTEWKQATTLTILDSPQFSDLDTTRIPRSQWIKTVLKERWDALDDADKLDWQERAEEGASDVASNQAEFGRKMHAALTDLSQGGLLGDAELLLFYGFRNPTLGDLDIGTHSSQNRVNFGGSHSEMQASYGNPWAAFAESVIPRPIVKESSVIPQNPFGVPVFLSIDLNIVTPADTRVLLMEYWSYLWAHPWSPDSNYPPIPWAAIANNLSGYYDTTRFNLPLPFIAPQTLNTLDTTVLAEHFVRTSSLFKDSPFVLFPKHPTTEETVSPPEVGMAGGIGMISDEPNSGRPGSTSVTVHIPTSDESNSEPGGALDTVHTPALHDPSLEEFNTGHTPVPHTDDDPNQTLAVELMALILPTPTNNGCASWLYL
ncbi:hypothetical protein B0H10DRAFT_2229835 [Mycena sp. CBHHK59/15]|nr:hypothetical protein B0H10DRAFT_2229835 [Mycena sp. CBHHK59/15]